MERHCSNALKVAEFLSTHPEVSWVNYPGLANSPHKAAADKYFDTDQNGGLLGFGLKGGKEAGAQFIDRLKIFSHLANIGDAKSLAIHPAAPRTNSSTSSSSLEFTRHVRLSVGIEDIEDLIADLDQALA